MIEGAIANFEDGHQTVKLGAPFHIAKKNEIIGNERYSRNRSLDRRSNDVFCFRAVEACNPKMPELIFKGRQEWQEPFRVKRRGPEAVQPIDEKSFDVALLDRIQELNREVIQKLLRRRGPNNLEGLIFNKAVQVKVQSLGF